MKYSCSHCQCEFNSKANLVQHENNSTYCNNFAYIVFMCKKCYTSFHTIKAIQSHFSKCLLQNDKQSITIELEHNINKLSTCKKYSRVLQNLKTLRRSYLNYMSLVEYRQFIIQHFKRIEEEFKKRETKIPRFHSKVLSSLELRLIQYKKITTEIAQDERDFLVGIIKTKALFTYLNSYFIALFPISDLRSCFLSKIVKYDNKYYFRKNLKKNSWILDESLDYFTRVFTDEFIAYCISLYRDIYKRVFTHNKFIRNMELHSPLIEYDCNQILYNIFFILNNAIFKEFLLSINCHQLEEAISISKEKKVKKSLKTLNSTVKLLYDNIEDKLLEDFIVQCHKKFDI